MATAKVTGQMEAILPEAAESSCDQDLPRHSRQDHLCVCGRERKKLFFFSFPAQRCRDLTQKTVGISLDGSHDVAACHSGKTRIGRG